MALLRVLATDYDGTLTAVEHPEPAVLAGLAAARERGLLLVLVTGRQLRHLLALVPDALTRFDAVVAENGGVLARGDTVRALGPAPPPALLAALVARGVPIDRGDVVVGTSVEHSAAALAEIARLGLDVQLVRNRSALMLLPSGVTKGSGLHRALGELGVSYHNTVAVGDAENDHALFEVCELAVAVSNAIPALQAHADVVLGQPAGAGVLELLSGPLLDGRVRVPSRRLVVDLGEDDAHRPVRLSASPSNLLVTGGSGSGKSSLAGLIVERLVQLDYGVCVIDPEGDYELLEGLRGVVRLGGASPSPAELGRLLTHRFLSVVFDTSEVDEAERPALLRHVVREIGQARARSGSPQWLVADEAHVTFGREGCACDLLHPEDGGLCLVSYMPGLLCPRVAGTIDATITMTDDPSRRRAVLAGRLTAEGPLTFTTGVRGGPVVRHRHKYARARLPPPLRFYFRHRGAPTGRAAANLHELADALREADDGVLAHHLDGGDFSRWVGDVVRDGELAVKVRELEHLARGGSAAARGHAAAAIVAAIEERYLAG